MSRTSTERPAKKVPFFLRPPTADTVLLWHMIALGILAISTWIVYSNCFKAEIALESRAMLLGDARVQAITDDNLTAIFNREYIPGSATNYYRPITTLSYLFNWVVMQNADRPAGYHWINLFIHIGNAFLFYLLMLELLRWFWPALTAAALFSLHPLATEAVINIAGRAELLGTMSVLGAVLCYIRSMRSRGPKRWGWLAGMALISGVGVFCHELALSILLIIPALDLIYRMQPRSGGWQATLTGWASEFLLRGYLLLVPLMAFYLFIRHQVFASGPGILLTMADNPMKGLGLWNSRWTAIKVMGRGVLQMLLPINLSCDYSYNQIPVVQGLLSWQWVKAAGAMILFIGLILLAVWMYRRSRALTFLMSFWFIAYSWSSNLFSLSDSIYREQYYYPALAALAGCLVIGVDALCRWLVPWLKLRVQEKLLQPWQATIGIFVALLLFYGVRSYARNGDWFNNVTLSRSAVQASPGSYQSHLMLAAALSDAKDESRRDLCIQEGEQAVAILESLPLLERDFNPYLLLGELYGNKGDALSDRDLVGAVVRTSASEKIYRKAEILLNTAAKIDQSRAKYIKEQVRIYGDLAIVRQRLGDLAGAIDACKYQRLLMPMDVKMYANLAQLYWQVGQYNTSAQTMLEIWLIDPSKLEALAEVQKMYLQIDRSGDKPFKLVGDNWQLNPACTMLRLDLSVAYLDLIHVMLDARMIDNAVKLRQRAVQHGCPTTQLDELLRRYNIIVTVAGPPTP